MGLATTTPSASDPYKNVPLKQMEIWNEMKEQELIDEYYPEAVEMVQRKGKASISMLQRRLKVGYTRSARMIDQMEEDGIIGPPTGNSSAREVLDFGQPQEELLDE